MDTKSLQRRLDEASNIRTQLQKLGILVDDNIRLKLKLASNEFIRTGYSSTFRLPIDNHTNAIVHFKGSQHSKSGIVLEYL